MYKLPILFIRDIINSRELLTTMTKRDIESRYLGSLLGGVWAFIQPLVTILVMWFVFQVGFRAQPVSDGTPYALWLISAMIPWFFIADALTNSTNSIIEQSNIVKKLVFKVSLLPIVKIMSALFIHVFFIVFLFFISILYGYYPSVYWLQVPYYLFCSIVLIFSISLITSSVIIFFKDVGQIIAVIIQLGFWITPILWNIEMIPESYSWILKINPMFYITEGYRNSIVQGESIFKNINWMLYYWSVTVCLSAIGMYCFKKLRPHFADVL